MLQSYNPNFAETILVWAVPFSFATTQGITICFIFLWLQNDYTSINRVSPFGNFRFKGYLHLIETYRSLSRPSSPMRAKASAIRP